MNTEKAKTRRNTDYSSQFTFWLSGLLFFSGGMMVMMVLGEDPTNRGKQQNTQKVESTSLSSKQYDKRVSRHLQELYHKRALDRLRTRVENKELVLKTKLQDGRPAVQGEDDIGIGGIDLHSENPHADAASLSRKSLTADDRIQQALLEGQNDYAENKILREEYIKAFRENARRDGFRVKLDKNLNVISIDPIN
jgi:hypothetical protein